MKINAATRKTKTWSISDDHPGVIDVSLVSCDSLVVFWIWGQMQCQNIEATSHGLHAAGPLLGEVVSLALLAGLWFHQALSSSGYMALKLLTYIFVRTSTNVI